MEPYVKTVYVNDSAPAISADNLNKSEQGIFNATQGVNTLSQGVETLGIQSESLSEIVGINSLALLKWEQGTLSNGVNTDSAVRIRTQNSISLSHPIVITIQTGYKYSVVGYSSNNTYLGAVGPFAATRTITSTTWTGAHHVRLVVQLDNQSYIYPESGQNVSVAITRTLNLVTNDVLEKTLSDYYEMTNYGLFCETYVNKIYQDGVLVDDPNNNRNSTSIMRLDTENDIWIHTSGNAWAVFFDSNKEFLSNIIGHIDSVISKNNFPSGAAYVAFIYYRSTILTTNFSTSTFKGNKYFCSLTKKKKDTRPIIYIKLSDSQTEILQKLWDAIYTKNCNVVFESGTYTFDTIYDIMKSTYSYNTAYEMPLGGGCRYYGYGSIFNASYPGTDNNVKGNSSAFGSNRLSTGGFELYDMNINSKDIVYCVHDEASDMDVPYANRYQNCRMKYETVSSTAAIRKCIGGGTGKFGTVEIIGCNFETDNPTKVTVGWHGHYDDDVSETQFLLTIRDCSMGGILELGNTGEEEIGLITFCGNKCTQVPSSNAHWFVSAWNNEIYS